jgi:acetoin:2,6-dichlorophenolindophenol oxidoreductase subunit alpha
MEKNILKSKIHEDYLDYNFSDDIDIMDEKDILSIYQFMLQLRMVEEAIAEEYHPANEMRCPIHLCIGQEAVSSVLSIKIRKDDHLLSHHRSHGYYLAKGCSLDGLICELYGKVSGSNKGLAGSQDISSSKDNFYSGAILTGSVGIAIGIAYSKKLRKDNSVVICCFGEGATDQGIFWEAMNYASLKKLPILFICENNIYATYSHLNKRMANDDICQKVSSFGVETKRLFGNDVVSLYSYLSLAYDRLKQGPIFLEAITYRLSSHVGPENDSHIYRPEKEIEEWKKLCPIINFENLINNKTYINKNEIVNKISKKISSTFLMAKKSKFFTVDDWESLNFSNKSNQFLKLEDDKTSSFHKSDTLPGPY